KGLQVRYGTAMEVDMRNTPIFKDLPATFPEENKYKRPAAAGSIVLHVTVVTALVLTQLLIPQQIQTSRLVAFIAPPPPPSAPIQPAAPRQPEGSSKPAIVEIQPAIKVEPGTVIAPTEIPKEILRIVDDSLSAGSAVGITGGAGAGVLRSVLLTTVQVAEV